MIINFVTNFSIDENKAIVMKDVYKLMIWCFDPYDNQDAPKKQIDKEQLNIFDTMKKGFFQ